MHSTRRRFVVLRALLVPSLVAGYVYVMGSTRMCPLCTAIVGACGLDGPAKANAAPRVPTPPTSVAESTTPNLAK
ncbi:MAG: hypothetical protein U0572_09710 [Phycisphaerales bacterium]